MISLCGVSKRFGARPALVGLDLEVPPGQIVGLLGHNGAGKSTAIGILLGQVFPDAGTVRINGHDVFAQRARALARVGAIFETPGFYDYLSGAANLRIFTSYTGPVADARLREVVRLVGLETRIGDRVATYSHGMRQRLALAQALLPAPALLILDEPSEGLDPEGIHEIRYLIRQLNREWGLTILFSSHLLSEVEQLCSHLAVLREGRLLFRGEWRQFDRQQRRVRVQVDRQREAEAALVAAGLVAEFAADGQGRLAEGAEVPAVAAWLVGHGYRVEALTPSERTLEDFYLEVVGSGREGPRPSGPEGAAPSAPSVREEEPGDGVRTTAP